MILIQIKNNGLFVSIKTGVTLAKDYRILTSVLQPMQASERETIIIHQRKTIIRTSMIMALIVPFALWVFLKSRIEQLFSMYLMMQLIGNLNNLDSIVLPGSVIPIIYVVETASNF